jgi:hypothetical protein
MRRPPDPGRAAAPALGTRAHGQSASAGAGGEGDRTSRLLRPPGTLELTRDPAIAADELVEAFGGRTFAWRWLAAVARAVDERPR